MEKSVSIAFQTDKPLSAYGPLARRVESYRFAAVSVYNDLYYQPAWLPLLEMARSTRRIKLGPAAVNPYTSHPINLAGNLALLDEASKGRAYLGLARGGWLEALGIQPDRPVDGLREAMLCIRHLLRKSTEPFQGRVFSLQGGETLRWRVQRVDIPFLLGSWGEKTIKACLDQISEVKIGGTASPEVARSYRALLDRERRAAQDLKQETGLVVGAICVIDFDGKAARERARREAAMYIPVVGGLDQGLEMDPNLLDRIRSTLAADGQAEAARLISDDMLTRFAFAGTPSEVTGQAEALFASGVDRLEFGTPHGLTVETGLELLGEAVYPALRSILSED